MAHIRSAADRGRLLELLIEQRTGILCAFASAALLATGSFVIDASPDLYAGLGMDDLRFFLRPWRWQHAWLYALVVVLAVWGTSALLCALMSVRALWQRRVRKPGSYGPPLLHLTFGAALVAHLWAGLTASSRQFLVSDAGTDIHGSRYRAVRLELGRHPGGMPRSVVAVLERKTGAAVEEVRVGYNHPLVSTGATRELLLGRYDSVVDRVVLRHRGQKVVARPGSPATAGPDAIDVLELHDPNTNPSLRVPVVELEVGGRRKLLALGPEGDGETAFVGLDESPVVELVERTNPSVPLVAVLSLLLVLGVGLVGWGRLSQT
jgi:hypothetical protein